MLPRAIELKAKELILRMEQGSFSENDITLLLIWLREYSNDKSIFKEIAHFIAHNKRNSGLVFLSLYKAYCRMRAYAEFQNHNRFLDLSNPVEKWFYDFVQYQLDEIDSMTLKKKYGFSRKEAKATFKEFFLEEKKGFYRCKKKPNRALLDIIREVLSFIHIQPLFTCDEIISSFSETFKDLGLLQNSDIFESHSNKLILVLLVLMHKRTFHIGEEVFGETTLDFPVDDYGKLKCLELKGSIQIPNLMIDIVITIIETPLEFEVWCEPDLLVQNETGINDHYLTVFDRSADLTIGENGKLRRL